MAEHGGDAMRNDPAPLTVPQVAERLGIKPGTVYALCAAGKMPHYRHGLGRGTIRVSEAQLARYLAAAESGGATAAVVESAVSLRRRLGRPILTAPGMPDPSLWGGGPGS